MPERLTTNAIGSRVNGENAGASGKKAEPAYPDRAFLLGRIDSSLAMGEE